MIGVRQDDPQVSHHFRGSVVKVSASRVGDPGIGSCFLKSNQTSDLKSATVVATWPGAWIYRVSGGTGQPGVGVLWLDEIARATCKFSQCVAACTVVQAG